MPYFAEATKGQNAADILLRFGVAFAFLFPAVNALFDPVSWFAYFPSYLRGLAPEPVLLHGFGLLEVIVALWILSGKNIFWPCMAATLILLVIILTSFGDFQVLFRDLSIAAAALALGLMHWPKKEEI